MTTGSNTFATSLDTAAWSRWGFLHLTGAGLGLTACILGTRLPPTTRHLLSIILTIFDEHHDRDGELFPLSYFIFQKISNNHFIF